MENFKEGKQQNEKEDVKIPLFTVTKNGSILKNIFVVNNRPPPRSPEASFISGPEPLSSVKNWENPFQETEKDSILIVGRHPECDIVLMHPSISRFHLQIDSRPASQQLFVTDLSSVHGTWVSDKKIEPGCRVELREGDTIRVGGSTRVYRLHWIPWSRANDMENHFVLASDVTMIDEIEEVNVVTEQESEVEKQGDEHLLPIAMEPVQEKCSLEPISNEEKICEDENLLLTEIEQLEPNRSSEVMAPVKEAYEETYAMTSEIGETQCLDSIFEGIVSLFANKNFGPLLKKEPPSEPPTLQNLNSRQEAETEKDNTYSVLDSSSYKQLGTDSATEVSEETECQSSVRMNDEQINVCPFRTEYVSLYLAVDGLSETNTPRVDSGNWIFDPPVSLQEKRSEDDLVSSGENVNTSLEIICLDDHAATNNLKEIGSHSLCQKDYDENDFRSATEAENCALPFEEDQLPDSIEEFKKQPQNLETLELSQSQHEERSKQNVASFEMFADDGVPAEIFNKLENSSPDCCVREFSSVFCQPLLVESVNPSLSVEEEELPSIVREVNDENHIPEPILAVQSLHEKSNQQICVRTGENCFISLNISCSGEHMENDIIEEMNNQTAECSKKEITKGNLTEHLEEEEFSDIIAGKESMTPKSDMHIGMDAMKDLRSSSSRSGKKFSSSSIWSRRGKPATALQLQVSRSKEDENGVETELPVEDIKKSSSVSKSLFSDFETVEGEENFTPNKENSTPNIMSGKFRKNKRMPEETQFSKSHRSSSSKISFGSDFHSGGEIAGASSNKENWTPGAQQRKSGRRISKKQVNLEQDLVLGERRVERIPLQTLLVNSCGKNTPEAPAYKTATADGSSVDFILTERKKIKSSVGHAKKAWNMVPDTTSLLDKELRKSLQLLQGVKGTRLIIPAIVVRELDCLKQSGNLFGRTTEASLALEWIEQCMAVTEWWIHIQSKMEERWSTAATPHAATQILKGADFSKEMPRSSGLVSGCWSPWRICSPTAEDHILEYALFFKRMDDDNGQPVLLSNDVTLKIKAMAEGLICETAEEFRGSLVNPFSERFLWADSSPRGLTWSVVDDVVLKETYYPSPSKKFTKREGAKGLKLIL